MIELHLKTCPICGEKLGLENRIGSGSLLLNRIGLGRGLVNRIGSRRGLLI